MLSIHGLHKKFQQTHRAAEEKLEVLKGVNLTIDQGEVVAIIGPSGSGKSTLLRCINFLERADQGTIALNGHIVDAADATKQDVLYMRRNTAMVFQNYNLFQNKTVIQNVMEGLLIRNVSRNDAIDRSKHYLDRVGILEKANEYPPRLSGGQQQRVGIARALAIDPHIILLDEPTSALDPELVGEVLKVIEDVIKEKKTLLIVTHEINFARQVSDKMALFDDGNIVEMNDTVRFFKDPQQDRTRQFLSRYQESFTYMI